MPKKPGSHHVVPNANGGWDVKKDEATRSSGHFDKKQDAVDAGRKISQTTEIISNAISSAFVSAEKSTVHTSALNAVKSNVDPIVAMACSIDNPDCESCQ